MAPHSPGSWPIKSWMSLQPWTPVYLAGPGSPLPPIRLVCPTQQTHKRTNAHVGSPSSFLFWDLSPWGLPCSQSHHTAVVAFSAEGLVRCRLQSQKENPHWFHVDVFPSGLFPMNIYIYINGCVSLFNDVSRRNFRGDTARSP